MRDIEEIKRNPRLRNIKESMDGFIADIRLCGWNGSVIFSYEGGWEHCSVSPYVKRIVPDYDALCQLKNVFWSEDEDVIQVFPRKENYVNNLSNCLHLWRCYYTDMILPPSCFVGIRKGQTREEFFKEVKEAYKMAGEEYIP